MFGPGFLRQKVHCSWNDRRIDGMIGPGGGGWFITSKMQKILQEKGARILCGTAAQRLICREDGQVTGVLAQDAGGPVEIRCAAVVIAAGAFTRNKAIMDKMQPLFYDDEGKEPVHIFTCSTCTGDGISMCEAIGADIDYVHRRVNMFGPMRHPYPGVTLNIGNGPMFRTDGVRYEKGFDNQEVSDLAFAPHRFVWKITNEANTRAAIEAKIAQGPDLHGIDLGHFLRHWKAVLAEEAEDHSVVIADTLEELAEKLGFDPERFVSDIAQYHRSLSETPPVPPAPSPDGPGDGEMDLSFLMGAAPQAHGSRALLLHQDEAVPRKFRGRHGHRRKHPRPAGRGADPRPLRRGRQHSRDHAARQHRGALHRAGVQRADRCVQHRIHRRRGSSRLCTGRIIFSHGGISPALSAFPRFSLEHEGRAVSKQSPLSLYV